MIIFTSIDGLETKNKFHKLCSYKNLDEEFVEWIEERTIDNIISRTRSEQIASECLKSLSLEIFEQPFFQIRGRSYFLDFLIPLYNIAIEIDGCSHKGRKYKDDLRDRDFSKIGITTIRIDSYKVLKGLFFHELIKKLPKRVRKDIYWHFPIKKTTSISSLSQKPPPKFCSAPSRMLIQSSSRFDDQELG